MKTIPYLKSKNHPTEDGVYFAGNLNVLQDRLEIERVTVQGLDVTTQDGANGYVFTDFDFWSDKLQD